MPVSIPEKTNATALTRAENRIKNADGVIQHIDASLVSHEYASTDREKLEKLKKDLGEIKSATDNEIKARQNLQTAYDESSYANKDADPEVKAKQKALAAVGKANKTVMRGKKNTVNEVCQSCLDKEVDSIMDCNTPYYVKYGKGGGGGPQYKNCHNQTLGSYTGWDELIKSNKKTTSEKNVLVAMSANEGDMDAVQAYDSEIVTVGAMQKTVNPQGQGELPIQLKEFRDNPETRAVFDRELGSKGYSVGVAIGKNKDGTPKYGNVDNTLYFTDPKNPNAKPITGKELDKFIQTNKDRWPDTLGPFRSLGRTPEFQEKQVLDFNNRLASALNKTPVGYGHDIGDYVSSEHGAALVLDQDVNRPGYVSKDFSKALDKFYKAHPQVSIDPAAWAENKRVAYEKEILDNYASGRRGTDMANRAKKLVDQGLSDAPNSLVFPP